jgi:hypothetical protein
MRQLSRQVEPITAFRPPHVLSHALQMVASGELCAIRQTLTTLQTMDDGDLRVQGNTTFGNAFVCQSEQLMFKLVRHILTGKCRQR